MIIAILGGTGKEGRGLALRCARAGLEVIIGSRDAERAAAAADELAAAAGHPVRGAGNQEASREAEMVVISVPFSAHEATLRELAAELCGKVVIDVAVPLAEGNPTRYAPPAEGSAVAQAQSILGPETRVVGAFQTVAAHDLGSESPLEGDVFITGNDAEARRLVVELSERIGARGIDAGGLDEAPVVEALTPLIIGLNKRYRRRGIGLRLTGI